MALAVALVAVVIVATAIILPQQSTPASTSPGAGATASATAVAATATATPVPLPALAVRGTQIFDSAGKPVTLIGVARESLEYDCNQYTVGDGHFQLQDFQAMRSWGANTVRITLSSEFWSGAGGDCLKYHQTVMQAVANAEAAGLYVMLTLQWDAPYDTTYDRTHGGVQCPMPDNQKDVAFWRDLATIYGHDQHVLFDLFSEPHDVSWDVWLNGGTIANAACYTIGANETIEPGTYTAIGMRALVAAVRAIAPQNIIVVSGLNWGYDLSELSQYAISGANIVYSTHPFDYGNKLPQDWPADFGNMTASFPIIAGEFGSYDCGTSYNSQAIAYFNAHHMSWLAWAWDDHSGCGGPSLLADWSGAPSQPYGAFIRQQMLATAKG
jgi:endoglucanase